ncbi:MAG: protein kinase [Planctomycetes bacterium]|nr:protein kinase [Planctomycetota bacterium]
MTSTDAKRWLIEIVGAKSSPVELPRQGVLTIGSDGVRADLVVDGQGVADVHCAIGKSKGGGWALKDLGSQYGTLVNGKTVTATRLEAGDVIALGSRRLRVFDPDAPVADHDTAALDVRKSTNTTPDAPLRATQVREAQFEPPVVRGYRVDKLLGKGGMGEVWLALQERLERPIALKVLKRQLSADSDFVGRFLAEARAAAALNHPNVVVVYDAGEDDGHHYLSMEYMDRGNLESRVAKSGPMAWKDVLEVLIEAAKGLQYAESKGIVHRDIKPANLMQNSAGVTKIADLGLAAHLDAEATQSEGRKIFGTPHFVSPEQAKGERVDHRSDLYSLGATAYRLLSGRTPFEGATTRDILRGHFTEQPKPLATLAPATPPAFARVVHKLLEKKPEDRYPSASTLLVDLQAILEPAATNAAARPQSAPRKKGPGVLPALALIAIAGAGYWVWTKKQEQDAERAAKVEREANGARGASTPNVPDAPDSIADPAHTTATAPKPADDDTRLKMRELQAEIAYRDLPKDMEDGVRRDALVKLAGDFAGTTVANKALQEAQELADRVASATRVEGERSQISSQLFARLQAIVDAAPPERIGSTLAGIGLVPGQEQLESDPEFGPKRRTLFERVLVNGDAAVRAELAKARDAANAGDFTRIENSLVELEHELALPELPADLTPAATLAKLDLVELARTTRAWHDKLVELRERYQSKLRSDESRAVAAGFGGPRGLERELATFDFAASRARLGALREKTTTTDLAADLAALVGDLERGQRILELVGAEFGKGSWRRKTIADPRKGKGQNRNAVTADARGISVDGDGGVETIPWSAFGPRPRELHQLFHERLTREWTADEQRAIAGLMRIASVSAAIDGAGEMLQTSRRATFSEGEYKELVEGFQLATNWAHQDGEVRLLAEESVAADLLGRALRFIDGGQWASAVANLERIERDHAGTLLFRLLTGGPGVSDVAARPAIDLELPVAPTALPPKDAAPQDAPVESSTPKHEDGR